MGGRGEMPMLLLHRHDQQEASQRHRRGELPDGQGHRSPPPHQFLSPQNRARLRVRRARRVRVVGGAAAPARLGRLRRLCFRPWGRPLHRRVRYDPRWPARLCLRVPFAAPLEEADAGACGTDEEDSERR